MLSGAKTVECRLTRDSRDPYQSIEAGDRIYFKQSAGPYRATALAEHVMFESDLTPLRVREIARDYDELVCGNREFWHWKRNSRFCTLIWLKDIQPADMGPAVPPLQGVAWVTLDADPAWRRHDPAGSSFRIPITGGNLRHGTLYVTGVVDQFPNSAFGGATKKDAARPVTLMLHEGPTVETDIVAARNIFRTRVWRSWFKRHGAAEGDHVVFTPVDDRLFLVGLASGT